MRVISGRWSDTARVIRVLLIEDLILLHTTQVVALSHKDDFPVVSAISSVDLSATTIVQADADVAVIDLDTRRTAAYAALHVVAEHAPTCCVLALTRVTA